MSCPGLCGVFYVSARNGTAWQRHICKRYDIPAILKGRRKIPAALNVYLVFRIEQRCQNICVLLVDLQQELVPMAGIGIAVAEYIVLLTIVNDVKVRAISASYSEVMAE